MNGEIWCGIDTASGPDETVWAEIRAGRLVIIDDVPPESVDPVLVGRVTIGRDKTGWVDKGTAD